MQHHGTTRATGFFRGKTRSGGGQTVSMNTSRSTAATTYTSQYTSRTTRGSACTPVTTGSQLVPSCAARSEAVPLLYVTSS